MANRYDRLTNDQLERVLRATGGDLAYPPTPDLAQAVRARLLAGQAVPQPLLARWLAQPVVRRLVLVLVVLIVVVVAILAGSPEARRAVAGRLGVPGITIIFATPTVATGISTPGASPTVIASPTAVPSPPPTLSVGERLGLGQRVSLAEAQSRVAFTVKVPVFPALGSPDEVYVGEPPLGGQVSFVWFARPDLPAAAETGVGMLVTQFQGRLEPGFIKKITTERTRLQFVNVNDAQGYWFEGAPHELLFTNAQGLQTERTRLAGNVLIWEQGGITYRIEGAQTLDQAYRIAASLR